MPLSSTVLRISQAYFTLMSVKIIIIIFLLSMMHDYAFTIVELPREILKENN